MFSRMSKCPYCSAQIKIGAGDTFVVCGYCGREMEVPRFTQEEKRLTHAVEEMRASTEAAEAALKEAMQRAEESDAQMEARIAALAEQQAEDSVRARMHRDEVISELRSEAVRQREEAKAHLGELKSEQHQMKNQLAAMQKEQQAGKAASLQHCYDLGENAQRAGRFDEAIGHFQELLVMSEDQEAEVHWRIVLCRYGVEYVREQTSGTFLPTITHMIVDSVEADDDFRAAAKYARSERMRAYYRAEAQRIDDILDKYRQVYGQERPYDVFISVKQGDMHGRPTEDSMIATDLYYMLTGMGLHVFNSRISLQAYAGLEYEPHIMAALMTAKVMLVVGTHAEYMNSPWVRNEWRRFRWLQENGKESRRLIAYIAGMKTGEIPKEMGALQIINSQTSGDPKGQLRRIVEKDFGVRGGNAQRKSGQSDQAKRLRRAELFLEEGNIPKCEEYLEMVLEDDPEAGMAYALKLCISKGVNRIDKLGRLTTPIDNDLNFRRAMSFGDEELRGRLAELAQAVQGNIRAQADREQRRKETPVVEKPAPADPEQNKPAAERPQPPKQDGPAVKKEPKKEVSGAPQGGPGKKKPKKGMAGILAAVAVICILAVSRNAILDGIADHGSAEKKYNRAVAYEQGILLTPKSEPDALDWYRAAALDGHVKACLLTGDAYLNGKYGAKVHLADAQRFLLAAAERGVSSSLLRDERFMEEAQINGKIAYGLYRMYENGWSVDRDGETALVWLRKAAELGSADAADRVDEIVQKARQADQDGAYDSAAAMLVSVGATDELYEIGRKHNDRTYALEGDAQRAEYDIALKYLEPAAEAGHVHAMVCAGYAHDRLGHYPKAYDLYRQAYEKGDPMGAYNIGILIENQQIDFAQSECIGWYEKALELEKNGGQATTSDALLGRIYVWKNYGTDDPAKGFEYLWASANQNEGMGWYYLGWAYENGSNTEKDPDKALEYYEKAVELGYEVAAEKVEALRKQRESNGGKFDNIG